MRDPVKTRLASLPALGEILDANVAPRRCIIAASRDILPKRTNTFQQLAASVYAQLQTGWSVEESRMLEDKITGQPREVDVVAEATVAGSRLLLSIECRDHGRRQDVTWIEGMAKKHETLPTSKLVLWSNAGFTKEAKRKADFLKIDLVEGRKPDATAWTLVARRLIAARITHLVPSFDSAFVDVARDDGSRSRHEPLAGMHIVLGTSEPVEASVLLRSITSKPEFGSVLLDHALDGAGTFYLEYKPPARCDVRAGNQRLGTLLRLGVNVRTRADSGSIDARSVVLEEQMFTLGTANLSTGELRILARERAR